MNKKLFVLVILSTIFCPLFTFPSHAMGGPAPATQEVQIIEKIASQTEEAATQEKYEMKTLMEIPWGSKPGELGTKVVEGLAIVPDRLSVDGKGNIYIFDKANNRINKYNKSGGFIQDYKVDSFVKHTPEGAGQSLVVQKDIDMGVDGTENIYILNGTDFKIRKINAKGEVVDRLPAPAGTNYIRIERGGRVDAIKYNVDGQIELFDVSSKATKLVKGFTTPGGLNIVIGENKGINEPRSLQIINKDGNLIKELEIKTPYELYTVDLLGTDDAGNIFLAIKRQSDETKLKEVEPNEFKTIRLLGWYVRKYDDTGNNLIAEEKFILNSNIDNRFSITGFNKSFSIDKQGNIYLMVMFGPPTGRVHGFKVFKWELKQ